MAVTFWFLFITGCSLHTAHAFSTTGAQWTTPERRSTISSSNSRTDTADFEMMQEDIPEGEEARLKLAPVFLGTLLGLVVALTSTTLPAGANADWPLWNYEGQQQWNADFPLCNGKAQSPIEIEKREESFDGKESLWQRMSYKAHSSSEIFNNKGKNVQVNGDFGTLRLPDGDYEVKQFHFHFPSEHTVNGKFGAGELHIVHQKKGSSGNNGLAVVGIILDEQSDPGIRQLPEVRFLQQLGFGTYNGLPSTAGSSSTVGLLDLNSFANELKGGFIHYTGSLTTPPCAEQVHWYVCNKFVPVSKAMIKSFSERFPENNRHVQLPYGRELVENSIEVIGEFVDLV